MDVCWARTIIFFALDHLWRQVVERAAQRLASTAGRMHRPTKIRDLDVAAMVEQQILWFDVAMDDVVRVAVGESRRQGGDVVSGQWLGEAAGLLQNLVHFTFLTEFENQVDAARVPKVAVQTQHILVTDGKKNIKIF